MLPQRLQTDHSFSDNAVAGTPQIDWDAFERDGVLFIPGFFNPDEAHRMQAGWLDVVRGAQQAQLKRADRFIFGVLPGMVGDIYRHPKLVDAARAYCGDDVALYMNRILLKDAGWCGPVAMHQDLPYFNGGARKLAVFIPLKPTQADGGNGGLKFVVGSHRYGNLERGVIDRRHFDAMSDLAPNLSVGDIVLMDFCTWHWSEAAVMTDERPLLQLAYQAADDGSFAGTAFGVATPTLVAGAWRTRHFAALHHGIAPDGPGR